IVVAARVLRQQLVDGQCAVRAAGDQIGERAAAVDPELPATVHRPPCAHAAVCPDRPRSPCAGPGLPCGAFVTPPGPGALRIWMSMLDTLASTLERPVGISERGARGAVGGGAGAAPSSSVSAAGGG